MPPIHIPSEISILSISTLLSRAASPSLSSHSWLPTQFLSAVITKVLRPAYILRIEINLAILEAGELTR